MFLTKSKIKNSQRFLFQPGNVTDLLGNFSSRELWKHQINIWPLVCTLESAG